MSREGSPPSRLVVSGVTPSAIPRDATELAVVPFVSLWFLYSERSDSAVARAHAATRFTVGILMAVEAISSNAMPRL